MTEVRLRFGKGARARFDVVDERPASILRAMARDLTKADVDPERAKRMLEDAAKASDGELRAIRALVAELTSGIAKPKARLRRHVPRARRGLGFGRTQQALAGPCEVEAQRGPGLLTERVTSRA